MHDTNVHVCVTLRACVQLRTGSEFDSRHPWTIDSHVLDSPRIWVIMYDGRLGKEGDWVLLKAMVEPGGCLHILGGKSDQL